MSAVLGAARAMNLVDANMSRYQGCMLTGRPTGGATIASGFAMHVVMSVLIAFVYAWAFTQFWGYATWALGLLGGLIHWGIAGVVLPGMDSINRCVRAGKLEPLGAFGSGRGAMMILGFLMGHLLFGLIVGWLYAVPVAVV